MKKDIKNTLLTIALIKIFVIVAIFSTYYYYAKIVNCRESKETLLKDGKKDTIPNGKVCLHEQR